MIAKKLRNSVLQLAVQGRLVTQDPADEPAAVVLEKIRAGKRALVRAGKLRKTRAESTIFRGSAQTKGTEPGRFYEKDGAGKIVDITDSLPFAIPESWEWVRLGQVVKSLTDGTHVTPKYVDSSGVPFLSVKNISSGKVDFSNCKYITEDEHRILSKRCNPEFGDILLTKVGTTGIPVLVDTNREFSLFVSVALLKVFPQRLSPRFLVFELQSPLVQEQARINTKGVGNKNWVMRDIAKTLLPLPPLAEQERIVTALDALLPKISEYEKSETKIYQLKSSFPDKLKKSVLQTAIQGRLVPQDPADEPASVLVEKIRNQRRALFKAGKPKKAHVESRIFRGSEKIQGTVPGRFYEQVGNGKIADITDELPFDIPESWEWSRLETLVEKDIRRGKSPRYAPLGDIRVLAQKCNLKNGEFNISLTQFLDETVLKKYTEQDYIKDEDIIINSTGEGTLGRVGLFLDKYRIDAKGIVADSHITVIRGVPKLNKRFLYLVAKYYQSELEKKGSGSTKQTELSPQILSALYIPLPPLAEQNRIVSALGDILFRISPLSGAHEKFSLGL